MFDRGAYIVEPERPWRAGLRHRDIYRGRMDATPHPATIRIFAEPTASARRCRRFLTIALTAPSARREQPVTIASNVIVGRAARARGGVEQLVRVCVPARGYGEVTVETPIVTDVYRDPTKAASTGETDRPAGLLLRWLALADEQEPLDRCPAR